MSIHLDTVPGIGRTDRQICWNNITFCMHCMLSVIMTTFSYWRTKGTVDVTAL